MIILALDTAMAACSAAIVDTDRALPLAAAFVAMERGHAEALAPMVATVLREAGLSASDIDRIAVTTGPGTFTGVRIGLALARGFGAARSIPVIGIDTLSAIAANDESGRPLLVACDARNSELYAASFDPIRAMIRPPYVTSAAEAARDISEDAIVIGSAARAVLTASGRSDLAISSASDLPVAAQFARLALSALPGDMPVPLYLRAPDAKPQSAPLRKLAALQFESATSLAAPVLSLIHSECFDEPWTTQAFIDLLDTPGTTATIAMDHDEVLGFVMTRRAADEAEVLSIGTRPFAQRRGVAQQLLDHQFTELRGHGVRHVFLEVAQSNAAARAAYTAIGFAEAGRRKNYYQRAQGREDAIVMRRELSP